MKQTHWYKDAIIYQIYPRSFKDSNHDGIGDIQGIISKLDYLKDLGINCVWLSPVYESPMDDNGYDISNYKAIHKDFGTMEDFDMMLHEMHKRDIKLIMDLVANHTSDEHKWFIQSKSSKDNPYRDYYIWKKGKGKRPPNNWTGFFGGSTWEYNETTDEYYLHLFGKKQPDVNWENPKVREEYKNILRFWLDKGVDGFRCDVITLLSKDQRFKNGKGILPVIKGKESFIIGPRLHEFLHELNLDVFSSYDCMTVGETTLSTLQDGKDLTDEKRQELSMVFNFDHTDVDNFLGVKWFMRKFSLKRLKKRIDRWQYGLKDVGWNSLFIENHDQRRSVGRFNTNDKELRVESSKMLATCFYFLKGTPFIYQGQELGMTNSDFTSLDEYQDIETHNIYKTAHELHLPKWYINKTIKNGSRDNARTPFQWTDEKYAGFSDVKPWLKVNSNKEFINAKNQASDENSTLNYFKKLIKIHKEEQVAVHGVYTDILPKNKNLFVYKRELNNIKLLVICSYSNKKIKYTIPKKELEGKITLLLNNYSRNEFKNKITLYPYECLVYKIEK